MKLTDLNPRWCLDADIIVGGINVHNETRHGMGLSFECPCCGGKTRLAVWLANPIDGGPPTDDAHNLWTRAGDSFETLTLSPSIDASKYGHWHGHIANGNIA